MTTAPGSNIARVLWDAAARRPGHPGLVDGNRSVPWSAVRDAAAAVAARLGEAGIVPGDRVGLFAERTPEAVGAFFGIVSLGAVAVNINEGLRPRQVEHITADAGARALLVDAALWARQPRPPAVDAAVLPLPAPDHAAAGHQPVPRDADDLALLIYTSGSTGHPKGVMVSHANLHAGVEAVSTYLHLTAADRIASLLPLSFDYGLSQLLVAARLAATLVLERSPLAPRVVRTLARTEVTVLPCVPPQWHQLLGVEAFATPLPRLRLMTNTGGRMPGDTVRRLRRTQPQADLVLMYGLTEAFRSTYLDPALVDSRPGAIGTAIPGAEVRVVNPHGAECPPGVVGELVHRGPTVARGYWNAPETTAAVFRPPPPCMYPAAPGERVVYSGDLARRDADGVLSHVGRRDGMIKTMGYRVSPDEIVEVLHASELVREAMVLTTPDQWSGSVVTACVVLADGAGVDALTEYCRRELPRHLQPKHIEARNELPRTASGKYDPRAAGADDGEVSS